MAGFLKHVTINIYEIPGSVSGLFLEERGGEIRLELLNPMDENQHNNHDKQTSATFLPHISALKMTWGQMHKRCVHTGTVHTPFPAHKPVFIKAECAHLTHSSDQGVHVFF